MKSNVEETRLSLVVSYMNLRKMIGILGFVFPIILVIGSVIAGGQEQIQNSISYYYHTNMRDVFVGVLCVVALFLFSYRGYDRIDNIAGNIACFLALGVAFFPTAHHDPTLITNSIIGKIHLISASLFFLVLTYFSLFLFTKSDPSKKPSKQKKNRNKVFRVCGYIMLGCIITMVIYIAVLKKKFPVLQDYNLVFWFETIALFAFGISWLTKGQLILQDLKKNK
ncbi:DUF998 domain-containing protein [Bacteroidota bacterium]